MMVGKLILTQHLSTFHHAFACCSPGFHHSAPSSPSAGLFISHSFPFVPVLPVADAFDHALNQISTFLWQCAKRTGGDVSGISSEECS